ncbi:MAG: hypothetical protein Q8K72_12365, partial [Acidimicrobiales bacterium]|nr:hypothetical protein [Acidimicrobiales bacterium]
VVEGAMDNSDRQLAEIRARLDAMGAPKVRSPRVAKKAPARTAKAPAKRAAPKAKAPAERAAPKATAKRAAEPDEQVFDYEQEQEQEPAPLLLNRRRPGARPRGSGPLAGA